MRKNSIAIENETQPNQPPEKMNTSDNWPRPLQTPQKPPARAGARARAALPLLATMAAVSAQATDGYFSDGYGLKAEGRGGVAITSTDDAFAGANNPATLSWGTNRVDLGIDWFLPDRSASRTGAGPLDASVKSARDNFFIPQIGYKQSLNQQFSLGVAVYGNGGMNTDYPGGQLNLGGPSRQNLLAGAGNLGVNFSQLFVAPTVSWKFTENQAAGLAPLLDYQTFKVHGLSAFAGAGLSQDPSALSDAGPDDAWGGGARIGYLWNITHSVSVGAAYTSRVYTTGFDKYRGLLADNGAFDVPQSVAAGVGWQALPRLRLAADYKWIDYASIPAVGNPSSNAGLLGQESGPGFGWRSISVAKAGADVKVTDALTLRTGYSFSQNPVRSGDVTFNIIAPGVVEHHLTFGATYDFGHHEVSIAYVHAFENSVTGASQFVAYHFAPPGTLETISMSQNSVGVQYSYKF
jgi:long-chain fatty acid transport protein